MTSVALVWGLIVYRIVAGMSDDDENTIVAKHKEIRNYTEPKEVFTLNLNYPDPFLKGGSTASAQGYSINTGSVQTTNTSKKKAIIKEARPITPAVVIDWSFIHYIGLIGNKTNAQKIGLANINSKETVLKEKDLVDGVSVLRLSKDTLFISYKQVKHFVIRGN